jgi:four helix bundle protein
MKGDNIANRILVFASRVVRVSRGSQGDATTRHVMHQLVRAATGGGSNYEEARGAESRADFVHKTSVAAKEVREALRNRGMRGTGNREPRTATPQV